MDLQVAAAGKVRISRRGTLWTPWAWVLIEPECFWQRRTAHSDLPQYDCYQAEHVGAGHEQIVGRGLSHIPLSLRDNALCYIYCRLRPPLEIEATN
jgi:hypothetical protein